MIRRLFPLPVACALTALALPAAAGAATVDVKPLASVAGGIGLRNGGVHVVQPQAKLLTVFLPDTGAESRQQLLFGDAGAATSVTEAPGRGGVWVGIGSGADRGFAEVNDGPGATPIASTAADFGCGPVGMAADQTNGHMLYSAPLGASACGTHGAGIVDRTGSTLFTDPAFPDAFDLQWVPGKLFVPAFADDAILRYAVGTSALTLDARAPVPGGSRPDGVTVGPEGKIYATLYGAGKVVALAPDAPDGAAPTVVADGLDHPIGIAADRATYDTGAGPVYVADSGSGRLLRIDTDGTKSWIDLPSGFEPGQLVVKGTDIWVTDLAHPQIAHVRETGPILADHVDVDASTGTASVTVDPNGFETSLQFVVANTSYFADWAIPPTGPRTVSLRLDGLTPGATYTVDAYANNKRGMTKTAHSTTFTFPAAQTLPPPPAVKTPVKTAPKPKAPKVDDLVKLASVKRCVAKGRVLLLTLRKQPAARRIASVTVKVGGHKARKYLARQLKHGLDLRHLPAHGRYRLTVTVRLATGRSYTKSLTYKACAAKRR